jgi:RHS repeat-associated protein
VYGSFDVHAWLTRRPVGTRRRLVLISLVSTALVASLLGVPPALAERPAGPKHLSAQREPLDDHGGEVRGRAWPVPKVSSAPAPEPVWPKPGRTRVALPLPGSRAADNGARTAEFDLEVLDRTTVPAGWRDGVVMRVSPPPTASVGSLSATVSVDYSKFRHAYGAEWASRLRLWRLPECALTKPDAAGCDASALPSVNRPASNVVSAAVPVGPAGALVALDAGPAGPGGDFAATTLSPSATWSAGGSGGAFNWTYPVRLPPGVAGAPPTITLSYSSASVDGRSSVTNNQPSWLGEGFEYSPGFIERRYMPCAEDMAGTANNDTKTGDLCWRSDNATMSLNGTGAELVLDPSTGWHARQENGAKIEKLIGATNGDNNGEHWKVTTTDGTQYFFGLNRPTGHSTDTKSTWTVPVFGNNAAEGGNPTEPCHATAFINSDCAQAWRWNLDYVIDTRGNTTTYWYDTELNQYAQNATDAENAAYTRGGTLMRIDYGTWDRGPTDRSITPIVQVVFDPGDRCESSCATHNATSWPDVPWDQECALSAGSCPNKYSPTFWSTKRLAKITTKVWDTTKATPAWQDVESWTMDHGFPPSGDGTEHRGLWLESIVHAGHVGGTVTMPPVTFTPVAMPNRVLTPTATTNNWRRIDTIVTETGALINIDYTLPECTSSNLPAAPHTNTKRCYPAIVTDPADPEGEDLITEYWHKYAVTQVSESDLQIAGGHQAVPKFTRFEYVGTPAWRYADDDGLTKPARRTWNQYRGYETVRTRIGDVPGEQTLTVSRYLRGLHGDRLAPAGGTRTVTVPASIGSETVFDEDQFAGMVREETVYNGQEGLPVTRSVTVPWRSAATATRTIGDTTVTARFTNTRVAYAAESLGVNGAGGWRTSRSESQFDPTYGTITSSQNDGDLAVSADESCTGYAYNRNLAKHIVTTVKQTTTTSLTCGTAPTDPSHVVGDVRYYYDGGSTVDTVPQYGSLTKTERLKDWTTAGGTVWQVADRRTNDAFGRVLTETDVRGTVTTTTYMPASGGPVTSVSTAIGAPLNWPPTTVDTAPYWGSPTRVTDSNGRVTEATYDALGRVAKVWRIGWDKAAHPTSPSVEYTYVVSPTRSEYPYVVTTALHAGGGYRSSYEILDSLLRPRQAQVAAVGGGRVVTDTIYDHLGRAATTYGAHAEPGTPSGVLWWEPEWSVPAVHRLSHDNAGRVTADVFLSGDGVTNLVERWRTTTAYEGNLIKVTPPVGAVATTKLTDIQGRTTELREHTTTAGVTGPSEPTRFSYNRKGQMNKVTDPAGNEWTYEFDIKGRPTVTIDPDRGQTVTGYNDFDEAVSTTDARGEVLVYTYDALGRKTATYDDSVSAATKRAEWKYDRLYTGQTIRGQLTETIRYEPPGSANAYKWQVRGFTTRYQPTGVNHVIPAVEGAGLSGTWVFGYGYSPHDGAGTSVSYPAGGGLAAETVTARYDATTGLPTALETNAVGVGRYVLGQQYTAYAEPTLTTRRTDGGPYVEDDIDYDEATRRVVRTTVQPETAAGTVSDRTYTYDGAGNITSLLEAPQVGPTDKQCYRYDPLQRLDRAWTPNPTIPCSTAPTVGGLGGPAPYWLDWSIDKTGSRIGETSHAAAGDTMRTYTVPVGGAGVARPHAVTAVTTTAPSQSAVTTRYAYDNAGNTTCRPSGATTNTCPPGAGSQTLTWDPEGRLSTVVVGANSVETNVYDANGARLVRRDAAGTTVYLGGEELRREGTTTTGTRYYAFGGRGIASRTPSGLTWLYADHQGTQQVSIDSVGQQVTIRRQTPYGVPRGGAPVWPNSKGFVGGDVDPTGLVNMGARRYDPGVGRFVSVDPLMDLSDPKHWNGYAYANNNPVTHSDPTGLDPGGGQRIDMERERMQNPCGSDMYMIHCNPGLGVPPPPPRPTPSDAFNKAFNDDNPACKYPMRNNCKQMRDAVAKGFDPVRAAVILLCDGNGTCIDEFYRGSATSFEEFLTVIGLFPVIGEWADAVSAAMALYRGDWKGAAVSLLGMIPFLGGVVGAKKLDNLSDAGRACRINSFDPDTLVLLADGTVKRISDVRIGDRVVATDPETGVSESEVVTQLHRNLDQQLTVLTVVDESAVTAVIRTTWEHPFWSETRRAWVDAAELYAGERLHQLDGRPVTVVAVSNYVGSAVMLNLTVDDTHTYYVVAGGTPVLVHNSCDPALANWRNRHFQFGNAQLLLDRSDLTHILQRHHPAHWNGTMAPGVQTFFDADMSIADIEGAIESVLRQNRDTIVARGSNGMYNVTGRVGDREFVLGINNGHVGQFYQSNGTTDLPGVPLLPLRRTP